MKIKYVHTNIIAKDWKKVSRFYQNVFGCKPVPPERNLSGEWLDKLTGIENAHVTGERKTKGQGPVCWREIWYDINEVIVYAKTKAA